MSVFLQYVTLARSLVTTGLDPVVQSHERLISWPWIAQSSRATTIKGHGIAPRGVFHSGRIDFRCINLNGKRA